MVYSTAETLDGRGFRSKGGTSVSAQTGNRASAERLLAES